MKMPNNDRRVVELLAKEKYSDWISGIRGIVQLPDSPTRQPTVLKKRDMDCCQKEGDVVIARTKLI